MWNIYLYFILLKLFTNFQKHIIFLVKIVANASLNIFGCVIFWLWMYLIEVIQKSTMRIKLDIYIVIQVTFGNLWFRNGLSVNESGRFGVLKSDSTHHFFRNACTKSESLRFSQFSGYWLILSVYINMSFDFPFIRLFGVR